MRWWDEPVREGDTRQRRGFLWLPKLCEEANVGRYFVRWLEWAEWREVYRADELGRLRWTNDRWENYP